MNSITWVPRLCLSLCCILALATNAAAQSLPDALRDITPKDTPAAANERQYLYTEFRQLWADLRKEEKLDRRSTKKQIKKLVAYLEENVLQTYDADATVTDVFRNGTYNDATAAAVAAVSFNEFGIDHQLFVDHFYAHLIADTGRKKVDVNFYPEKEVSAEVKRAFLTDYVALLSETALPDLSDRSTSKPEAIFNSYYYSPKDDLSLRQFGAYLQFRYAENDYAVNKYQSALDHLETALDRDERAAFLVFEQAVHTKLNSMKARPVSGSLEEMYAVWHDEPSHAAAPAAILRHFDEQQRMVLTSNKPSMTRDLLASYLRRAPAGQEQWERQMMQLQSLRMIEHYITKGQLSSARKEAGELHQGFPDSTTYRQMLSSLIMAEVSASSATSEAFKRRILQLAGEYPFLLNSGQFANVGLRERALAIRDLYATDQAAAAQTELDDFRAKLRSLEIGKVRSIWTLTAFYAASDYHFRMADYPTALRLIDEALSYAADDPFLNHRRSVLVKYL